VRGNAPAPRVVGWGQPNPYHGARGPGRGQPCPDDIWPAAPLLPPGKTEGGGRDRGRAGLALMGRQGLPYRRRPASVDDGVCRPGQRAMDTTTRRPRLSLKLPGMLRSRNAHREFP